jgi:hypothetical protein
MGGQQGIAGHRGMHRAVAQDEMWQDCEDRSARGALDPPDGDPTQTDTHIMGVARQAPAPATGGFVFQLKAEGHDEGEDTFEERLAIVQQLEVGRFAPEIDGDGAVVAGLASGVAHGSSSRQMVDGVDDPR